MRTVSSSRGRGSSPLEGADPDGVEAVEDACTAPDAISALRALWPVLLAELDADRCCALLDRSAEVARCAVAGRIIVCLCRGTRIACLDLTWVVVLEAEAERGLIALCSHTDVREDAALPISAAITEERLTLTEAKPNVFDAEEHRARLVVTADVEVVVIAEADADRIAVL